MLALVLLQTYHAMLLSGPIWFAGVGLHTDIQIQRIGPDRGHGKPDVINDWDWNLNFLCSERCVPEKEY